MSDLPEWIPTDAWAAYMDMRKKIRKPMTEYAQKLAIGKLHELMLQGQDVAAVLDQSTLNSWQGLFELRVDRRSSPCASPAMAQLGKSGQATANNALDWLEGK